MKKNKTICIIDDEIIVHFIINTIISKFDNKITVLAYNNGEEAIISFKKMLPAEEHIPDIVLLDINMPVMDGWQFLDEFIKIKSQINKKIAIYILSSSSAPEDINKSKSYSAISGYLSKPLESDTLRNLIRLELGE